MKTAALTSCRLCGVQCEGPAGSVVWEPWVGHLVLGFVVEGRVQGGCVGFWGIRFEV
jgi:hypothetical protein